MDLSAGTAQAVLAAVVGASIGLIGFVVTVSVLVVQMATGTFSARYMRLFYRDGALKAALALLVGTFTFSFTLLRSVETDSVPSFGVTLAGLFLAASVLMFLFFLDRAVHRLRPVAVAALVARSGRSAFEEVVRAASRPDAAEYVRDAFVTDDEPALVVRSRRAGAIQALDADGLVRFAHVHAYVVVVPKVAGDFVPEGAVLIEVYGGTDLGPEDERPLRTMVALGVERTIEQDPAFAIRVMVDIAIRALSPAVNDPTTVVQVLNHLGETLRLIGATPLDAARGGGLADGPARVVIRTRRWEDFLTLGVTEIREYGGASIQVMRRLRAMLEELREGVLPEHGAAVVDEIARLDATIAEHWSGSVDLDRASIADRQGIGGPGASGRSA